MSQLPSHQCWMAAVVEVEDRDRRACALRARGRGDARGRPAASAAALTRTDFQRIIVHVPPQGFRILRSPTRVGSARLDCQSAETNPVLHCRTAADGPSGRRAALLDAVSSPYGRSSASAPVAGRLARFFEMVHEGVYLGTLSDTASTTSAANPHLKLLFGYPADAPADGRAPVRPGRLRRSAGPRRAARAPARATAPSPTSCCGCAAPTARRSGSR